jgi:hypothetical protein
MPNDGSSPAARTPDQESGAASRAGMTERATRLLPPTRMEAGRTAAEVNYV